ncbi:hypothetical protein EMPG_10458 [Blastomyces silverae]|uniref:MARVEL domain-containing protein n=1 Tax=Blastomyces silverae TaxID=2060906 RepID=A0A0H1BA42_9EURO|nr:hypothetical protein EMPG_10458 [Blastomyces silverae]
MEHNSENTPLLTGADAESPPDANEQTSIPVMRNSTAEASCMTFALTWLSLALSVLAFAFTFTVLLGIQFFWRDSRIDWIVRESCAWMMILGMCTALISFLNLGFLYLRRRAMPLVLNLVIDVIVVFYSFGCTIPGLIENYSWCEWDCDGSNTRVIQIVAGIGLSFGLGLGITHLVLFLMRCTLAIRWLIERRRNGSTPSFRIPTGQFTVEITFKLLRHDNADVLESTNRETRGESITAEANRELV